MGCEKTLKRMGAAHSPPCMTARRGGCVINECCEATETDAAGVVFLVVLNRKTTPASRSKEAPQCFLIARPPLLAVMQGGECARPKLLDTFSRAPAKRKCDRAQPQFITARFSMQENTHG